MVSQHKSHHSGYSSNHKLPDSSDHLIIKNNYLKASNIFNNRTLLVLNMQNNKQQYGEKTRTYYRLGHDEKGLETNWACQRCFQWLFTAQNGPERHKRKQQRIMSAQFTCVKCKTENNRVNENKAPVANFSKLVKTGP